MKRVAKRPALSVPRLNTWIMTGVNPNTASPPRFLYSLKARHSFIHLGDYEIVSEIKTGGVFYHGVPASSQSTWLMKLNQVGSDYKGASCDVDFSDRTNASMWINSIRLKLQYDSRWRVSKERHPVPVT